MGISASWFKSAPYRAKVVATPAASLKISATDLSDDVKVHVGIRGRAPVSTGILWFLKDPKDQMTSLSISWPNWLREDSMIGTQGQ